MRRLIALVSLLVAVDLTLWSAIVPLIPHYRAELGLTKVESGWLVAAFSLSVVVVAIPPTNGPAITPATAAAFE